MMLIHQRFFDVGQIGELACNWDLDFQQIQAGPLSAHLLQQLSPEFGFVLVEMSRCIKQEGMPLLAGRSFSLFRRPSPLLWYESTVGYNDLLAFHPFEGFKSVSAPGFSCFAVTISEAQWRQQLADRRIAAVPCDHQPVLRARPGPVIRLRHTLELYYRQLISAESLSAQRISQADCIDALFTVVDDANRRSHAGTGASASVRGRALRLACDLIYARLGEAVTVPELCSAAGVSERTLQYAFMEHTGQSPKTFIRSYRLGRVRDELLRNFDREPIATIAARWGFSHMGQFARYYRDQFDELPSHT